MSNPQTSIQFLTLEEARAIDGALMSTMEKFMTRITISSLRIIIKIAQEFAIHGEELTPLQIVQWIERDSLIRQEQGEDAAFLKWTSPNPDLDFEDTRQDEVTPAKLSSHEKFLTRMVISSLQALGAIAKDYGIHIEDLTAEQIIAWSEHDAKVKREQS